MVKSRIIIYLSIPFIPSDVIHIPATFYIFVAQTPLIWLIRKLHPTEISKVHRQHRLLRYLHADI